MKITSFKSSSYFSEMLGVYMHLPVLVILTSPFILPGRWKKLTLSKYLNKSYPAQGDFLQKIQELSIREALGKGLRKPFLKQGIRGESTEVWAPVFASNVKLLPLFLLQDIAQGDWKFTLGVLCSQSLSPIRKKIIGQHCTLLLFFGMSCCLTKIVPVMKAGE